MEIDALVAIALRWTSDDLTQAYRTKFPILAKQEYSTFYDARGRIVQTGAQRLSELGYGLETEKWNALRRIQEEGKPLPGWAHDALGPYEPPFDRCDREADMRQAYAEFVRRGVGSEP